MSAMPTRSDNTGLTRRHPIGLPFCAAALLPVLIAHGARSAKRGASW